MGLFKTNKFKLFSDEELMKLVCKRNNKAFEELHKRYINKIHYFFFRILNKDNEKAKDFTQDLFIKVFEKCKGFDSSRKFSTWFYALALNMCKNEIRKDKKANMFNEQINKQDFILGDATFIESLDLPFYKKQLDMALESLEEQKRIVFILRYQEELSVKEIAEILQCPEGTVKSRIFYAIESLSKTLTTVKHTMNYEYSKQ